MAEVKKGKHLGRGLDALFDHNGGAAGSTALSIGSTSAIGIGDLYPGRNQPRQNFAKSEIEELAESIRNLGIIQPIIVRPDAESARGYEIIAGERRWRAAQLAQLDEVPVIIRDITDSESLEIALVENLQRENLSPLEEAEGYRRLIDEYKYTQDALGQMLGKSRSHVANTLRLLALPDAIKDMINSDLLSAGHGRALLGSDDPLASAKTVVRRGLNVRQTERLVAKDRADTRERKLKPQNKGEKDADTIALENDLSTFLGLKVGINFYDPGGRLTITYRSLEQLDEILHRLTAGAHTGALGVTKIASTGAKAAAEILTEDEAELTAAAVAEINQLDDNGSSDPNILSSDVDVAIAEMERGVALQEDNAEVEFDLEASLTMSDDELVQLVSDTPVIDVNGRIKAHSDDKSG